MISRPALAPLILMLAGCAGRPCPEPTTPVPALATETPAAEPIAATGYEDQLEASLRHHGIELDRLACNRRVSWAATIRDDARAFSGELSSLLSPEAADARLDDETRGEITDLTMNWFIRVLLIHGDQNNLGAVVLPSVTWTDDDGQEHPLVVFHSATTPAAEAEGSCLRSLIEDAGVRHVINLYDGEVPLGDLLEAEGRTTRAAGATYVDISQSERDYDGWRHVASSAEASAEERAEAAATIARLLREQVLRPGGEEPRGHVYFHCAGGMHRSPLLSGILRRCVAGEPMEQVEEAMQVHSAFVAEGQPSGWEPELLEFVRDFDCSLLEGAGATAP